jgi:hypothetical protein
MSLNNVVPAWIWLLETIVDKYETGRLDYDDAYEQIAEILPATSRLTPSDYLRVDLIEGEDNE